MTQSTVPIFIFAALLGYVVEATPYGGGTGASSGASSYSDSGLSGSPIVVNTVKHVISDNGPSYSQSNAGSSSGSINVAPAYTGDSGDSDESDSTNSQRGSSSSIGVVANAGSSSRNPGGNFVRVATSGFGNSQGTGFAANSNGGIAATSNGGNGMQVIRLDASSAQDIGAQIQATIQQILSRFGIAMNQNYQNANMGGSVSYQPGRTYVFQSTGGNDGQTQDSYQDNGAMSQSQSQSQYQTIGGGQPAVQQVVVPDSGYGQNQQVRLAASRPVFVSYKLISTPGQTSQGMAMSVQQDSQGSGSTGAISGAGSQSSSMAGSGSQSSSMAGSGSDSTGGFYTNKKAAAAVAQQQQQQQQQQQSGGYAADQQEDSADYSASQPVVVTPVTASAYGAPAVTNPPLGTNKVRYGADNQKSESTGYEQDSS